ncbi:jg15134 [Pararge aegeria aegeria]|uniref:Jg15134 protein n=1 Tax=Pararge aegeria aegeria TaxID=348720 RepID=A0A8S4S1Q4_9NEOP|nr:jg15134 [Pararge aegeria aegeria]
MYDPSSSSWHGINQCTSTAGRRSFLESSKYNGKQCKAAGPKRQKTMPTNVALPLIEERVSEFPPAAIVRVGGLKMTNDFNI